MPLSKTDSLKAFRLMSSSLPDLLNNNSKTQSFVAICGNLRTGYPTNTVRVATANENTNIPRTRVLYRIFNDLPGSRTVLIPDLLVVTSTQTSTFDTVFVVDNGSINLGSTEIRELATTYAGNQASFSSPSDTTQFRAVHNFLEQSNTLNAKNAIATETGSATFSAPPLSDNTLLSAGRFMLAAYSFTSPITAPAGVPLRLKLGKVNFNYE